MIPVGFENGITGSQPGAFDCRNTENTVR